jgi:hypothetical protein
MVRDRIVIGVRNPKLREKLINQGSELTLEKSIEIANLYEMSASQAKSTSGEDPSVHMVHAGTRPKQKSSSLRNQNQGHKKMYDEKPVENLKQIEMVTSEIVTNVARSMIKVTVLLTGSSVTNVEN